MIYLTGMQTQTPCVLNFSYNTSLYSVTNLFYMSDPLRAFSLECSVPQMSKSLYLSMSVLRATAMFLLPCEFIPWWKG